MASVTRTNRLQFLQVSTLAFGNAIFAPSAWAAKYGSFGAGSPEVIDPKTATVDDDILKSEKVQKSLSNIQGYLTVVQKMQEVLAGDDQANLGPIIRKYLEPSQLREDLNTVNSAFDEDTQRGTDRLIRGILQDVTELELSNKQKDGVKRSERRLGNINAKLTKLGNAFKEYLQFL